MGGMIPKTRHKRIIRANEVRLAGTGYELQRPAENMARNLPFNGGGLLRWCTGRWALPRDRQCVVHFCAPAEKNFATTALRAGTAVAASLAPAVTAVRAPRLDRMACDRLADRCTGALLLLPVTSLLDTSRVLHTGGGSEAGRAHAPWLLLAAGGACPS